MAYIRTSSSVGPPPIQGNSSLAGVATAGAGLGAVKTTTLGTMWSDGTAQITKDKSRIPCEYFGQPAPEWVTIPHFEVGMQNITVHKMVFPDSFKCELLVGTAVIYDPHDPKITQRYEGYLRGGLLTTSQMLDRQKPKPVTCWDGQVELQTDCPAEKHLTCYPNTPDEVKILDYRGTIYEKEGCPQRPWPAGNWDTTKSLGCGCPPRLTWVGWDKKRYLSRPGPEEKKPPGQGKRTCWNEAEHYEKADGSYQKCLPTPKYECWPGTPDRLIKNQLFNWVEGVQVLVPPEEGGKPCTDRPTKVCPQPDGRIVFAQPGPGEETCYEYTKCEDGTTIPIGQKCKVKCKTTGQWLDPGVTCPTTKTCPDGSVIGYNENCPKWCENLNRYISHLSSCPHSRQCPDGKMVPYGTACATYSCWNGSTYNTPDECPPRPTKQCWPGVEVFADQECPYPTVCAQDVGFCRDGTHVGRNTKLGSPPGFCDFNRCPDGSVPLASDYPTITEAEGQKVGDSCLDKVLKDISAAISEANVGHYASQQDKDDLVQTMVNEYHACIYQDLKSAHKDVDKAWNGIEIAGQWAIAPNYTGMVGWAGRVPVIQTMRMIPVEAGQTTQLSQVTPANTLGEGISSQRIEADVRGADITRVYATVVPPTFDPTAKSEFDLARVSQGKYAATYHNFTMPGEYTVIVNAENADGIADPMQTTVTVLDDPPQPSLEETPTLAVEPFQPTVCTSEVGYCRDGSTVTRSTMLGCGFSPCDDGSTPQSTPYQTEPVTADTILFNPEESIFLDYADWTVGWNFIALSPFRTAEGELVDVYQNVFKDRKGQLVWATKGRVDPKKVQRYKLDQRPPDSQQTLSHMPLSMARKLMPPNTLGIHGYDPIKRFTYTTPINPATGRDNTPDWVYVWVLLENPEQVERAKELVGTLGWNSELLSTVYQYPVPPKVDITSPRTRVATDYPRIKATLTSEVGFPVLSSDALAQDFWSADYTASPSPVRVILRGPDYSVHRPGSLIPLKNVKVSGGGNKLALSALPEESLAAGTYTLAVTATDLHGVSDTVARAFTVIDHKFFSF